MTSKSPLFFGALSAVSLALCAGAIGCRDREQATMNTTTGATTTLISDAAVTSNTATTTAALPRAKALNDSQILEVAHTANMGEIAQAKLAQQKATDPRVKSLAAMMLSDHTEADKKGSDVAQKDGLSFADSPESATVKSDSDKIMSDLTSKTGSDFDKAYVDAQVSEHQAVILAIDSQLLPDAKDGNVKALVTAIRPKIEMHLEHAQKVQSDLEK